MKRTKNTKRLMPLILVWSMVLSLTGGYDAKAAATLVVTLRVEQDMATELAPVSVTLTDEDKKDFGIGLGTSTLTPLHALAKYLQKEKNVSDADMKKYIIASESQYGLFVSGISITGDGVGSASAGGTDNIFWSYYVNDTYAEVSMDSYALKDGDSVVFCGMWSPYPAEDEVLYAKFDKAEYSTTEKDAVTVTLMGSGVKYDENFNAVPYSKAIKGAAITAVGMPIGNISGSMSDTVTVTAATDDEGKASLVFDKAGTYVLSAARKAADGVHPDISRPYAKVTVTEAVSSTPSETPVSAEKPTIVPSAATSPTAEPSAATALTANKKKVTKPSGLKVTVKKGKVSKKKVTVTWKKAKCYGDSSEKVTGYEVSLSKKKNGYKKIASTKKTKLTFKKGKGKYYIKVRAYKIYADTSKVFSSYTTPISIKIK